MLWLAVLISQNCSGNSTNDAESYKSTEVTRLPLCLCAYLSELDSVSADPEMECDHWCEIITEK